MWNTPNGQVCFSSGAFASLLGYTVRDLTDTIYQKRKGNYGWDLFLLLDVTRCLASKGSAWDDYSEFDKERSSMIDAIFAQIRVNLVQEYESIAESSKKENSNQPNVYVWHARLCEAFWEVALDNNDMLPHDFFYDDQSDDDVEWDDMLEYLKIELGRSPAKKGDCVVDYAGNVYFLYRDHEWQCGEENDSYDEEEGFPVEHFRFLWPPDNFIDKRDDPEKTAFESSHARILRQAERDVQCTRNELIDLCDQLIAARYQSLFMVKLSPSGHL